jgi:hypothetical protein
LTIVCCSKTVSRVSLLVGLPVRVAQVRRNLSTVGCFIALLRQPVTCFRRGHERVNVISMQLRSVLGDPSCGVSLEADQLPGLGPCVTDVGVAVASATSMRSLNTAGFHVCTFLEYTTLGDGQRLSRYKEHRNFV